MPDPSFPNHDPNPVAPHATDQLVAEIKKYRADIGAIVDGDGDRILFADETGRVRYGDEWGSLFIREVLAREPGAAIVVTAASGRMLLDTIREYGGKPIISKVGHTFIKQAMREAGAILGVEFNGHFYFRKNFYTEDSYAAFALLLSILDQSAGPASALTIPFRRYVRGNDAIFHVRDAKGLIAAIGTRYHQYGVSEFDGVSVAGPAWWFNLRPSNTEPVVRLNTDADSPEQLKKIVQDITDIIRPYEVVEKT